MQNPFAWRNDLEPALNEARLQNKTALLMFHREQCAGCSKMETNTYTDGEVQRELMQWFIPVEQDILQNRAVRSKYSAYWTPSFYFLDGRGRTQQFFNGYLNSEDFRVVMRLGKAAVDMPRGRYFDVIALMDNGLELFPDNPRAASLLLMRGMAEYLIGREKSAFRGAMSEIVEHYPSSPEARMWPWTDSP